MFDPNEADRVTREVQQLDREEAAKKPAKRFEHREMASRCPKCRMRVMVRGRDVCEASGKAIIEQSGTGACAFLPAEGRRE